MVTVVLPAMETDPIGYQKNEKLGNRISICQQSADKKEDKKRKEIKLLVNSWSNDWLVLYQQRKLNLDLI